MTATEPIAAVADRRAGDPADVLHASAGPDAAGLVPGYARRLRGQLSARDLAVIADIAALRLVSGRHVQQLRFVDGSPHSRARRARATLARLHDHQLVTRSDRRIGGPGSGSASHVYRITPRGRAVLGLPNPRGGRRRQLDQPSRHHTNHTLAIANVAVALVEAHRAGRLELLHWETEPRSWRTWTGLAGDAHELHPDALAVVATDEWEHLAFVEVDLGTEHLRTIRHKVAAYQDYARSGHEQARWGVFPRVVFLGPTETRRQALTRAVNDATATAGLVSVAALDDPATALTTTPHEHAANPTRPLADDGSRTKEADR